MKAARSLALFAALLLPATAADAAWTDAAWREASLQQAKNIISTWQHEAQGVAAELAKLPDHCVQDVVLPEEEEGEDTVISCGGAMLFDTASHNIVYEGGVTLRDPRLKMEAARRLFVRLPENELTDKREAARQTIEEALPENTPKPRDIRAEEAEPQDNGSAFELPAGMAPLFIRTTDAVVDAENNHIIFYTPCAGNLLSLSSGENSVEILPDEDNGASIVADADGNITLAGASIVAVWVDDRQQRTELRVEGGSLCYNAAEHSVALTGKATLSRPAGTVCCTKQLMVRLQGEHEVKEDVAFLQQFSSISVKGVAAVHAEGGVEMSVAAAEGQPASSLRSEVLDYDAETGLCSLSGEECELDYAGQYSLQGAQSIVLSPDGALTLEGRELSGRYERPAEDGEGTLVGSFRTGGLITLTPKGDHAEVALPQGITASDPEADFSCTGELTATLLPTEGTEVPQVQGSKLNLALLRFRTLDRASATGGILARRYTAETHQETAHLQAERAEFDLSHNGAELFGTPATPILAAFNGNTLEATPDGDRSPHLIFSAEGDAELRGGMITASFTDEKQGTITARCAHALRLIRAENRLETEGAAEFRAEEGLLTTNGPLHALLVPAAEPETGHGFRFPYSGIREAATEQGGTMQSTKGSMQCDGRIRVTLDPDAADNGMGGVQTAEAQGHVAIAGKDASGRLIRATGDRLSLDGTTGEKMLSGGRVTLSDGNITHIASGAGAAVRIDARNNASVRGAQHTTTVNRIREQIEEQIQKKEKP